MNASKVARGLRDRIGRFSGDVSEGLGVVAQRFVAEMIYGIQASESVLLTEVGRTLAEPIALKKTQERLSRNLQRPELEEVVQDNVTRMAARQVGEDTLLILDPSDLSKKYAKKMEYLARVRDGSAHDIVNGYWMVHVMGAQVDADGVIPLYQRLYSAKAPDFESENEEILRAMDAVGAHVGQRGLWVMDRGGDRINLFAPSWIAGTVFYSASWATATSSPTRRRYSPAKWPPDARALTAIPSLRWKERARRCTPCASVTEKSICLLARNPCIYSSFTAWAKRRSCCSPTNPCAKTSNSCGAWCAPTSSAGLSKRPSGTSKPATASKTCAYSTTRGYRTCCPWSWPSCTSPPAFSITTHGCGLMAQYVERAAKRLFGIPDFKYYALADGLRSLFARHPGAPRTRIRAPENTQLPLFT